MTDAPISSRGSGEAWLRPDLVFDGVNLLKGRALCLRDGQFVGLTDADKVPEGSCSKPISGLISPGFFDIQVNGGGGVLFNSTPTVDGLQKIAAAHLPFGTTALLPTVITDAPEVLEAACDAALSAVGASGIQGIHIEGPHISIARRGTHNPRWVRMFDKHTRGLLVKLREAGVPVLMTVAPEGVAAGDIAELVEMGVVVSLGHTDATAQEIEAALAEGAQLFTHLFNGMSQMQNREPGAVGAGLNSSTYCSIIADGLHVADDMLRLAIRARPVADRMILISDAMPTLGGPGHFSLYGHDVVLSEGKLINREGSLAGAHISMFDAFVRTHLILGCALEDALRMAVTNPARLMGLEQPLATLNAELIHVSPDFSSCSPLDQLLEYA